MKTHTFVHHTARYIAKMSDTMVDSDDQPLCSCASELTRDSLPSPLSVPSARQVFLSRAASPYIIFLLFWVRGEFADCGPSGGLSVRFFCCVEGSAERLI